MRPAIDLEEATGYTAGMTQRIGPKGQVVIPKPIRDELGIRPGDEVVCTLEGRSVRIVPASCLVDLRGAFRELPLDDMLRDERRRERG
jgi:AbrB family looped-hinge helix DNA binding protein